jgi:hypothetical protein
MINKIQKLLLPLCSGIMAPLVSYAVGIFAVSVLLPTFCDEVRAQDPLELEEMTVHTPADQWGLALTPCAWFAAQSSDVGGKALRQSFNDLASITNVGFQIRALARWRWVIFTADWTYANQKSETVIWRTSIDMQLNQHIMDGFYQRSFSKQDLIIHIHQGVFHIITDFGNQMNTVNKQGFKKLLEKVSLIAEELSPDIFKHLPGHQGFSIIDIGQGDHKVQQLSFLIDNKMKLKAKEPANTTLASLGNTRENFMRMNPPVMTDSQGSGIDKRDTGTMAHLLGF